MHYLHKILVYIPDVDKEYKKSNRAELIDEIRSHAEDRTESYYEQAYDWRETDTAGRWEDIYPNNVILASDDVDGFVKELEECLLSQKREIDDGYAQIKNTVGTDLTHIIDGIWNMKHYSDQSGGFSSMTAYYLHHIADLLHGDYNYDSMFYNTHDYTGRIYPIDIDDVKKSPEEWALVMFDYHY